jgi:hypothetical protein
VRLAKLSAYRQLIYVPGSAPSLNTLRKQIRKIPGGTILGGHYYVDLDELDRQTNLHAAIVAQERVIASNPLLVGLV